MANSPHGEPAIAVNFILLAVSFPVELKAVTYHKNLKTTLTPFDVLVNGSRPITKSPSQGGMNDIAFDDLNNSALLPVQKCIPSDL